MATAQLGTLKEFNSAEEPITSYLERVQLFFAANSVARDKQVPTFLSAVGPATYSILRDLCAPALPSTVLLADIFQCLKKHYEPKRATIVERYHFHKRDQVAGETIAEYDAALRNLATHCQFADYLEEALWDRFVCGIQDAAIQRRLLAEKELTLAKAMDLALSMEAAEKNTRSVKARIRLSRRFKNKIALSNLARSSPAIDAGRQIIQPQTASSRMLRATPVERRVTLRQPADLSPQQRQTNNADQLSTNGRIWFNQVPLTPILKNFSCSS